MSAKGKLRTVHSGHAAYCLGCEEYHVIYDSWQFNGDFDHPTFSPSLFVTGYSEKFQREFVCHSFITNGEWQFLSDCTHELKSQTVPLRNEEADCNEPD